MNAYASTYDPHSNYFSPRSSEEYRIQMSLNYEGIGASLQLNRRLRDGHQRAAGAAPPRPTARSSPTIASPPSARATTVPLTDVIGWRLDDVVQLIRGKVGTVVRLQMLPAGAAPGQHRARAGVDAQQGHARGAGGQEGSAHAAARRPAPTRSASSPCRASTTTWRTTAAPAPRTRSTTHDVGGCCSSSPPAAASMGWCSICAGMAAATCPRLSGSPHLFIESRPGRCSCKRHHRSARSAR